MYSLENSYEKKNKNDFEEKQNIYKITLLLYNFAR